MSGKIRYTEKEVIRMFVDYCIFYIKLLFG